MPKRTKIVATLGPATDNPDTLAAMLHAGVDVVRINFSHGTDFVRTRLRGVRACMKKTHKQVGIMGDLQGPKIRITRFEQGSVFLEQGATFTLDAALPTDKGNQNTVGVDYKALPKDVQSGDTLLLDDGRIVLKVRSVQDVRVICEVAVGGELKNNKGINRLGGGLTAEVLTEKDKADLKFAVALKMDYIALSFPRGKEDIMRARALLEAAGSRAYIIAKIERAEAVANIEEIIAASDGVMVARGDLAVEIGEAEVPAVQKHVINRARALNKPVITATQMMESMIENAIPTRAEVSDVANAVLDQTDAVMLSAETAVGKCPVTVIETVARVCVAAEKDPSTQVSNHRVEMQFHRVDEAIAMAAVYTANHLGIRAIIALTESGMTPLMMSRLRTGIPIYGLSRHLVALGRMTLYRDVYPIYFKEEEMPIGRTAVSCIELLQHKGLLCSGDLVLLTQGDPLMHAGTNTLKIVRVN